MIWRNRRKKGKTGKQKALKPSKQEQDTLFKHITENEDQLRMIYQDCSDVIFHAFTIGGNHQALLLYIDGLSNTEEIDDSVLSPLMTATESDQEQQVDTLIKNKVAVTDTKEVHTFSDCVQAISAGKPVILADKSSTGLSLGLSKWEKRAVESPEAEKVVRGPREGFVETLSVNTSMLRRRIRSPKLKIQSIEVGRYTKTSVMITYVEGLADNTLIEEVTTRLNRIDIDGVLESGVIEEFIEDDPYSPFPQVLATERPDIVTSSLLEGRVTILVDGTPFSLVVPITLYSLLQSNEDYYRRFLMSTATRWLRYLFLVIALLLPSLYVALLTYHQEMIPTSLLISMAASREQVPFPALVEVLLMEVTFEALREAGVRLPKQVGSAVSIVGALVIGEAAVSAGIVSAPMVIVVAITGIASFTIPRYSTAFAIRMLRFPMILLAATLGLLGIMLGVITIIVHLATLRSFGVPYLSPMAPMHFYEMKDTMIRAPWWKLNKRPRLTGKYNKYRQSSGQKPDPIRGEE
ncbi:spore germination protein [Lentibacillus kapialis]|uniref:Spore germination protein n=1 Tax=Lentibacillus kapialis TaxID=340214 RepID=A0A917UZ52_9BACI|nr:spore germination protein [Lentibacillus kapialis]GGJ99378.1 spore germination protein [Lentibacillus kapialis]